MKGEALRLTPSSAAQRARHGRPRLDHHEGAAGRDEAPQLLGGGGAGGGVREL